MDSLLGMWLMVSQLAVPWRNCGARRMVAPTSADLLTSGDRRPAGRLVACRVTPAGRHRDPALVRPRAATWRAGSFCSAARPKSSAAPLL